MPTPSQLLLDPVSLSVFALYAGLIAWEWMFPARRLPAIKGWRLRGVVAFLIFFFLSSYLSLLWSHHLAPYQLFDLSGLGTWRGALIALLVYELAVYLWHRAMHRYEVLWRLFHQMHHSAERLDTFGAFYFSPWDMAGWTFLSSLCLTLVGVDAQAVTVFLLLTTFLSIIQHANVRTPRWLGYVIQRPESHTLHHRKAVHAFNYSDLPIFDMLFSTWRNPVTFEGETGFYLGASRRLVDLLLLRDVSRAPSVESATSSAGRHFHGIP